MLVPARYTAIGARLRRSDRPQVSEFRRTLPANTLFPRSSPQPDRFIPNRSALDLDIAHYNLVKENANANDLDLAAEVASPSKVRRLSVNILSATNRSRRVKPFPLDRASPD